jgi:hypothetical protein
MSTQTVKTGTYLEACDNRRKHVKVIDTPQELLPLPGMFVVQYEYTGLRMFARLTGRTRIMYGYLPMPTVEVYAVDTVVAENITDGSFALWGIPGERITGTFCTSDRNLVTA